jgi:hypothetical protein
MLGHAAVRAAISCARHAPLRPAAIMQVLPAVAGALQRCEFFALDCEMTGLFLESNKSEYLDDVQDRWGHLSSSRQRPAET